MKVRTALAVTCPTVLLAAACGGSGSLPSGWEDAAQACAEAFVLDQVIQSGGEGFVPERVAEIPGSIQSAAIRAADSSSEYDQLQLLVGNMVYSIQQGDTSAVLDLVAVEGECERLGFGTEPPQ